MEDMAAFNTEEHIDADEFGESESRKKDKTLNVPKPHSFYVHQLFLG